MLVPPWSAEQVENLNRFQSSGQWHPFTCGNDDLHAALNRVRPALVATTIGWVCPDDDCDYMQAWAHPFMADPAQIGGNILPPGFTLPDGATWTPMPELAAEARVVARLRLPIPAGHMLAVTRGLERCYGRGLVIMTPTTEWLVVSRPAPDPVPGVPG